MDGADFATCSSCHLLPIEYRLIGFCWVNTASSFEKYAIGVQKKNNGLYFYINLTPTRQGFHALKEIRKVKFNNFKAVDFCP